MSGVGWNGVRNVNSVGKGSGTVEFAISNWGSRFGPAGIHDI